MEARCSEAKRPSSELPRGLRTALVDVGVVSESVGGWYDGCVRQASRAGWSDGDEGRDRRESRAERAVAGGFEDVDVDDVDADEGDDEVNDRAGTERVSPSWQ
jgi:hypothetical protein